jgi:hypothetical protein
MTACFQNADCVGYFYCPSGDTACYTKYTAGANLYNTFISCFTNSCSTECGG